jgi:pimeloyl-ACP methyl ester carboxylesterase
LDILGYGDERLPCVFYNEAATDRVALVFPGASREGNRLGGSPARPDLHFTRAVLEEAGLAVFEIWWDAGAVEDENLDAWIARNAEAAAEAASADHNVDLLVGRSLGTLVLAHLVGRYRLAGIPTIWLAPLLRRKEVRRALSGLDAPALLVGGTADDWFDVEFARSLQGSANEVVIIEGGNHALEVSDPEESALLLSGVLHRMRRFVSGDVSHE